MELYYQNETLFVDIDTILDEESTHLLKSRIFRIIDDYDIDHIILNNREKTKNKQALYQMQTEYHRKYDGSFLIK